MTLNTSALFRPFQLKRLTLPNRVVMAPMTRSKSPDEVVGDKVAAYYRRRAEGGCGLIITEGTTVNDPVASNDGAVPAFHGKSLDGWAHVVGEVHAAGGLIAPQLWHTGMMRKQQAGPRPELPSVGPSGLVKPGKQIYPPMTDAQIATAIEAFAQGAADAERLGFDAIELHGAHGYLIDQFFWDGTNQRDDRFGGNLAERTRFAAEIVKAVRARVSPDYPVILRFSQWKQQDFSVRLAHNPDELLSFLQPLVDAGVDCFHCSTRRYWEPEFEGSDLNLAGWTKKLTGLPTITVGSVSLNVEFVSTMRTGGAGAEGIDALLRRLEADEFDLVAVGRSLIVNPDWALKVKAGRIADLAPYSVEALAELV
ncbi:NADH:flavin oxidoreductase [Zavarzinia sp. CC-PAN008]|uniref:NADH:flavin oxidoreductase n=1 Tax=Zavarzinia sp. CC-PAN008 TaxID=3243332 RepID=UPI003F746FB9